MDKAIRGPGSESCLLSENANVASAALATMGRKIQQAIANATGASRDSGFGGGHGIVASYIGG